MNLNAIFTVFKKELFRFFKDKRTMSAILLPGILIYVIYSFMGSAMSDMFVPDEEYMPIIYCENAPDSFKNLCSSAKIEVIESFDIEQEKQMIRDGDADLFISFPENFDQKISEYSPTSGVAAPNIEIFFNSSSTNSSTAFETVTALLDMFESAMTNKFDINNSLDVNYNLASDEDMTAMVFSMMMPMLLIMLLFSGCMAVAPESIAGEKERGTIASLLITPTKRSHIAIGKILALSVVALISGTSSTLGVVLSLPNLMGEGMALDGSVYTVGDYAMLAVVILSTVLLLITLISVVSAFAKTVKEASSYVTPLMVISMVVGLAGMFGSAVTDPVLYLIPLFNSVQCMIGIFSFELNALNAAITVISNVAFTAIGVLCLARMFNSEKIMFNK